MATTTADANTTGYSTDPNGNEISRGGKIFSGILLIVVTLLSIAGIIALWPDKMPPVDKSTKYHFKLFAITYIGNDSTAHIDTTKINKADTFVKRNDSANTAHTQVTITNSKEPAATILKKHRRYTIDLNTLLLLLVAISGFLGNLIHISASFTNFVGAGKFKKSWTLWYFVKPFTAAALAIGVYIIFRAGFLNSSDATASVNLYGVVAMAFFSGLFTDKATDKLKDVFGVIFQSSATSGPRPDPLVATSKPAPATNVTDISPLNLVANTSTVMNISGTGLDAAGIVIKVGERTIAEADLTKTSTSISFNYIPTTAGDLVIVITSDKGGELKKQTLTVTAAA